MHIQILLNPDFICSLQIADVIKKLPQNWPSITILSKEPQHFVHHLYYALNGNTPPPPKSKSRMNGLALSGN